MSSQAGPSSSRKSKANGTSKKSKAPEPIVSSRSKETVDTDEDESSSEEEPDSEGDLEDVQPKRKAAAGNVNGTARSSGSGWPRYAPPSGMTPINVSTQYTESPFEWDALASRPNVQLWAVRVPADFKPKYLASLQLSNPASSSSSSSSPGGRIGSLKTKTRSYNLVPAGHTSKIRTAVNAEGRDPTSGPSAVDVMRMDADQLDEEDLRREGGEEMQGMSLLLPRLSKKGKLFVAPKPVSRHLILEPDTSSSATDVDHSSSLPSFLSTGHAPAIEASQSGTTKRVQPTHLFKFRNNTVGYDTPGPNGVSEPPVVSMDVDVPLVDKKKRRKSEKGESDTPKKKKSKV